ncbi:hypothetical protein E3N88_04055 [Mikania micrantha]|uniref:Reverse transcriptase domain-containing protein n=1 Tax=Mikania micrantha TaxID=192012 RepID=A0A5N6PUL1_9ASTR|nr:hypothetical protein E3N88_04055 [Mikania micrantha]
MMERYREKKRDLHMVFIDLEKAYDSVPRQVLKPVFEHQWERQIPSQSRWDYTKSKGLRISRSKTEYLYCNFSGSVDDDNHLTIGEQEVPKTTRQVGTGGEQPQAFYATRDSQKKLKGKFYKVAVRRAMMYGSDCWPIKKIQARKLETTEMRMLRWMSGHTRIDRIRKEVIRERLGVACISNKVREGRLRWFGHVRRRS